jgi:nucleoside-diphosphate-sugar epimerase
MRILIIGGTGLISTGIVKHLLTRKAEITMLNRAQRENRLASPIPQIIADRNNFIAFEASVKDKAFDVVIDMICFKPEQAESDVRAFAGRCGHFIFCSTVCTYGVKTPANVLVDETFPQQPISDYGRGKVACEKTFLLAHEQKKFPVTIIRPSHTYGPGLSMIDNLEPDPVAWDRIQKDRPILCAGDGLGMWVSTHRDDCGKLFAHAAMNPKTFGQSYNATRDTVLTWRDYLAEIARVLGKPANVLFMPADWIVKHDPKRFQLLKEITAFHGAYSSAKAKRDVPEFRCEIDLRHGVPETLEDAKRRNAWKNSDNDATYEAMVAKALDAGIEPVRVG